MSSTKFSNSEYPAFLLSPPTPRIRLGEFIAARLKQREKTKGGLAKALGKSNSAVSALLQGKRGLALDEISTVSSYIEVDPLEILRIMGCDLRPHVDPDHRWLDDWREGRPCDEVERLKGIAELFFPKNEAPEAREQRLKLLFRNF